MNDLVANYTALPNLHPALVHFPIAFLPLAVILDALVLRFPGQREWLDRAATLLYGVAALGAAAAFLSGRQAAEALPPLALAVQVHVNEHSDSARAALWLVVLLAAFRTVVAYRDWRVRRKVLRVCFLLIAAGAVVLVYRTADLGGGLVFRHGIGVAQSGDPGAPGLTRAMEVQETIATDSEDEGAAERRLVTGDDGSLSWRPLPGDRQALGSFLLPAPETDDSAVSWGESAEDGEGLGLTLDGEALLLLPGAFGDVQVEAELVLEGFEGEVGLAHHVLSGSQSSLFTVAVPGNEFVLSRRDGATTRRLARSVRAVPEGPIRLLTTAAGRHYYGYLGEESVVHGHEAPPPKGGCGLFLRGRGVVRILSLTVTPGGS